MIKKVDKSAKKEKKLSLIYGIHPIVELLKAKKRKLYTIYTTKPTPKSWNLISPLLTKETQIQYVNKDILNKIAQTTDHQGVVGWAQDMPIRKKFFDPVKSPLLIMLDTIQDTRNLGAILRSTYCAGFNGVITTVKNSAPLNATALKSSAGLAEHLEIYQAASPQAAILELKKAGYKVYLATLDGKNATKVEYNKPLCLVVGNEAIGVSRNILSSGEKIKLPQKSSDISYNASVAAGILLFIIATQTHNI